MRLLLFNLMTDESDPVLGFACEWIRRLAPECESVDVLTMYRGDFDTPSNTRVYSAGRERGWSRARRLANFYRHLLRLLAANQYDVCFAHMMPLFAGLAGPLLTARGIQTVLWYTHRQRSAQLRLGLNMSWRAVSAHATSFPYQTDKLRVIGHGIDTEFYAPYPHPKSHSPSQWRASQDEGGTSAPVLEQRSPFPPGGMSAIEMAGEAGDGGELVVQVGRLAPIKHQATAIEAVAATEARLALIGGAQTGGALAYERALKALAGRLDMGERCAFTGDLPAADVRAWFRQATVAVNMSPSGLFDKAALESMACGAPTIVCNPAFKPLLGDCADLLLTAGPEDVAGLRDRLERLFALSDQERADIGARLRDGVARSHSLDSLIGRLLAVLRTGELPGI
ncbi:MAG: glycosyltransferase family 4 protein [Chloroflexota bacterium]|nr:glycosyltransferase family 4 protein [Chloroflexota bacterium]MDE2948056.1 glycosyltransferase family 4 protein [Chloroflexota bacterium]